VNSEVYEGVDMVLVVVVVVVLDEPLLLGSMTTLFGRGD
jgi:hypothetical protein